MKDRIFQRLVNTYTADSIFRLNRATVAVIGVGGGGCAVSEILVRTGVGRIILVDGDKFESSNKNRQIGALESTLGKYKVDVMEERLKDINPKVEIISYREYLSKENYEEILCDRKITCGCDTVDGGINKCLVGDCFKDLNIPYITGGLGGYNWWVGTIGAIDNINSHCLIKNEDGFNPSPNPADVYMQAAVQAQEIINFILGRDWRTYGKIISFRHMNFGFSIKNIPTIDMM